MPALKTPMINAGMVFTDRHVGGINYPKGGVGNHRREISFWYRKIRKQSPLQSQCERNTFKG